MPPTKKPKKPTKTTGKTVPISSLASAVVTAETLSLLADAGLSAFRGSEAQALALLVGSEGEESEYAPICYGLKYRQEPELCGGCVFSSTCWQQDSGYLRRLADGTEKPPPHVPKEAVAKLLPRKRKAIPPTPKKRRQ